MVFEERGDLQGEKVIVLGRTGAGKSSLINMLLGEEVLPIGHVASTTRWVEGVRIPTGNRHVILVDTPGYGEVLTADQYSKGLMDWIARHESELRMVILVIQADSKAHADDKRILEAVLSITRGIPAVIVLAQADKLMPIRQPLRTKEWSSTRRPRSLKDGQIAEKIKEVRQQFGFDGEDIEPAAVAERPFNRRTLLKLIEKHTRARQTRDE